jgi:epoxyqueuosine reductase QueG
VFEELEALMRTRGAALFGYADLLALPAEQRAGLPFGVSMAVGLSPTVVADLGHGPTRAYGLEYRRVNRMLNALATTVAQFLLQRGHRAQAVASTGVDIDWRRLDTPLLPHKTVATRAGLGWIGKSALLVTRRFGSAIRLVSVLTDAALPVGEPVSNSRCGDCWECVEACPAGAPSGRHWRVALERGDFYDAVACHEAAAEMCRRARIDDVICGICIIACPWTRMYVSRMLR